MELLTAKIVIWKWCLKGRKEHSVTVLRNEFYSQSLHTEIYGVILDISWPDWNLDVAAWV